jgi:hypothetical protein
LTALLLVLVGCGRSDWTREAALRPIFDRLDADHDGKVSPTEYEQHAYAAPSFADADTDHDASISLGELETVIFLQDPNTFDGALPRTAPDLSLGPGVSGTMNAHQRLLWELFTVLSEDAAAARPDVLVPDAWTVQLAAQTGRLDSPESKQLLADLERAWGAAAGLKFPAALEPSRR